MLSVTEVQVAPARVGRRRQSAFAHSRPCHFCAAGTTRPRTICEATTAIINEGSLSIKHPVLSKCVPFHHTLLLTWSRPYVVCACLLRACSSLVVPSRSCFYSYGLSGYAIMSGTPSACTLSTDWIFFRACSARGLSPCPLLLTSYVCS